MAMHKILLILALSFLPVNVFAEKLDVIADMPSGTYHAPVHITLTPSDPEAKTFYSFKPDGYPNDAFLYTGSILLKHSTPIIYFSFLSTSDESKIKQNDYILEYPSTIHFENGSVSGSGNIDAVLVNSGSKSVNIGYWYVQSESDRVTVPEHIMLAPWAKYSIVLKYTGGGAVVLRSPDDDERDILVPDRVPENTPIILPKKKITVVKTVPRRIISTAELQPPERDPVLATIEFETKTTIAEEKPLATPTTAIQTIWPKSSTPPVQDINQIVKASALESGQKDINPLYLIVLLIFSLGIGWFQWFVRKRQSKTSDVA